MTSRRTSAYRFQVCSENETLQILLESNQFVSHHNTKPTFFYLNTNAGPSSVARNFKGGGSVNLQKPSKESGIFHSLSNISSFFTERRSQKEGDRAQWPIATTIAAGRVKFTNYTAQKTVIKKIRKFRHSRFFCKSKCAKRVVWERGREESLLHAEADDGSTEKNSNLDCT